MFFCGPLECGACNDNGRGEEINLIFPQRGSSIDLLATLGPLATYNPANAAMAAIAKQKKIRTAPKTQGTEILTTANDQRAKKTQTRGPGLKERGGKRSGITVRRHCQGFQAVVLVLGLPES